MPIDFSKFAIVILGASGDLARRKLVPALFKLYETGVIGKGSIVVGTGRSEFTDSSFRERFEGDSPLKENFYYHRGLTGLKAYIESKGHFEQVVFFMALPPEVYLTTAQAIRAEGFEKNVRLIIEKPFGYDYESARTINTGLLECYPETSLFRIDHYLAKEAVLNILVFRFANSLFEPVWNSKYIDSIQINACETLGVETRGDYFDKTGIIRDMVQNHLTQLLLLLTMDRPASLEAEDIRASKLKALESVEYRECHRRQYEGYRNEPRVAPDSVTETYAELKLTIDNDRWNGVPVYLRVGKALPRRGTEIGIVFKPPQGFLFDGFGTIPPNRIIFKIQPSEGIILDVTGKEPGSDVNMTNTMLRFCFGEKYAGGLTDAYQKLIADVLAGNQTLFVSAVETELSWKKIKPCLSAGKLGFYSRGNLPEGSLGADWIDFENYGDVCM
ncbi:MAG: glucose-6-phosphate dehydrogenase [Spirochaetales bacterium]|nr:glucose-6-phosphate dehydrogenase [Spirochaetales bacterium]